MKLLHDIELELNKLNSYEKGKAFEQYALKFISSEPTIKNAWSLKSTPKNIKDILGLGSDYGVDIIAETTQNELMLVQVKYCSDFEQQLSWSKNDLSNVFAENTKNNLIGIISNAKYVDKHSQSRMPQGSRLFLRNDLVKFDFTSNKKLKRNLKPRVHQVEALKRMKEHYKSEDIGKLILPCGSGKTLTAIWFIEQQKFNKIIIAAPSLALIKQWKEEFDYNFKLDLPMLIFCSDDSESMEERLNDSTETLITTDSKKARSFVRDLQQCIVFVTYQSIPEFNSAVSGLHFDIKVADEAHRTVNQSFGKFHDISSTKTLFMTATERTVNETLKDEVELCGMNDEKKYGKLIHSMSFGEAVDLKLLTDYRIILLGIREQEVFDAVKNRKYVEGRMSADEFGVVEAVKKLYDDKIVTKMLSFHSNNKKAYDFSSKLKNQILNCTPTYISSELSTVEREAVMQQLKTDESALVSNCRVLSEGVDVPSVDAVLFADAKSSKIDIVQCVGRAIRLDKSNPDKIGTIVLPVFFSANEDGETEIANSSFELTSDILRLMKEYDSRISEEICQIVYGNGVKSEFKKSNKISLTISESVCDKELMSKISKSIMFKTLQHSSSFSEFGLSKLDKMHAAGEARPNSRSKNRDERRLAQLIGATKNRDVRWPKWAAGIKSREEQFEAVKNFYTINSYLPSTKSKNAEEKRLGKWLSGACSKSNTSYSQEVFNWRQGKLTLKEFIKNNNFEAVKNFYATSSYLPSRMS